MSEKHLADLCSQSISRAVLCCLAQPEVGGKSGIDDQCATNKQKHKQVEQMFGSEDRYIIFMVLTGGLC